MITPFGLRHIWLVRRLQSACTVVDLKSALLNEPVMPLYTALWGYFLKSRLGTFTYVLQAPNHDTSLRGFAQAKGHKSGLAWNVVCLAPALDNLTAPAGVQAEEAATVWYRLLLHLCIAAGERHVQRLFAWVPENSTAEEVFRQAGFTVYCHERLFGLSAANAKLGNLSVRMSPMRPENRLDVQRLCYKITPRLVLQAEELSEPRNDFLSGESSYQNAEQGYTLYGSRGVEGYLCVTAGPRGVCLRLLAHPNAHECAAEMLDHALAVFSSRPFLPLYCTVREYEGHMQSLLEERGFALIDTYSLLVKHTTVRVKAPARNLVPALEKRAEIAPTVSRSEAGQVAGNE